MDDHITDADLKRGIRAWSDRLHVPVTRMMSRVLREEIETARRMRLAGVQPPPRDVPEAKKLARAILQGGTPAPGLRAGGAPEEGGTR
ncbi:hypothetical protein [Methylobacterium radiotolerans]|uniref:hypothetical protein n=1 Tax=Methylobacterium radiotolerans TaxID=31998 RepID=UPI0038D1DFFC